MSEEKEKTVTIEISMREIELILQMNVFAIFYARKRKEYEDLYTKLKHAIFELSK